jgi:hypothetical protein
VQLSLLGSVVSNLLLVLGTAFVAGGVRFSVQRFNKQVCGPLPCMGMGGHGRGGGRQLREAPPEVALTGQCSPSLPPRPSTPILCPYSFRAST